MSDEAIEETLEKVWWCPSKCSIYFLRLVTPTVHNLIVVNFQVVKLLAYISDKDLFAEFYR